MENSGQKFRVILLTHGGADAVLSHLSKLENVEIAAIFIENKPAPQRAFQEKLRRSLKYDGFWATAAKLLGKKGETVISAPDSTETIARRLSIPVYVVSDFHSPDSIELMKNADADLGVIYGTNIVKESVFGLPRLGSINLHQGLAPFYRGSAPVFWELFNDEPEVGITVHQVAAKVDAGEIVLQEIVPLRYDFERYNLDFESFIQDFRNSIKDRCAALVAESVRQIADGTARFTPQDISLGSRYKLPTKREKDKLKRRLRSRKKGFNAETQRHRENQEEAVKHISLFIFFCLLCVSASLG